MEQLKKKVEALRLDVEEAATKIDVDSLQSQSLHLSELMKAPDFWADNKKAQEITRDQANLERRIKPWAELKHQANDLAELAEMGDDSMTSEITRQADELSEKLLELKKELRFSGPYDERDVIVGIYAGAGGTDAQDWAQMLMRMYLRWAESHSYKTEIIDQSSGEEAGIKSATFKISGGDFLYGKLKGEQGVHRLVRQSPFNSAASRETSFAKVDILPIIDNPGEVEIEDKDLKIDVYRAGGHGGQSVNTTDSAVRITHLPSGITVAIQNERSQLQNKETALTILRSRLAALQQEQHVASLTEIKGPNQSAEWGNQIRNYVLHPYKQVKDTRSGYESSDPQKILDGDLDGLINSLIEQ